VKWTTFIPKSHKRRETVTQVRARVANAKNKKAVTNPIRIPSKQPRPYPRTREHQKEIEDKEAVPRSRGNCAADINER
jgi:hypothetical protein